MASRGWSSLPSIGTSNFYLERGAQTIRVGAGARQQACDQPFRVFEQGEQEMLDVDFGVAVSQRLCLRVVQRLLVLLREPVGIHCPGHGGS